MKIITKTNVNSYTYADNRLMSSVGSEQLFPRFMANDLQQATLQNQLKTALKSTQIINNKSLVLLSGFPLTRVPTHMWFFGYLIYFITFTYYTFIQIANLNNKHQVDLILTTFITEH